MSQYFAKVFERPGKNVEVESCLSNYATKADLKGTTDVDTCNSAAISDLASSKAEVDKTDVDKLKTVPVVDNDSVKNTMYDKVVTKVNAIDTGVFALKNHCNIDKPGLEKKIDDADKKMANTSGLVKRTDYNAKITEIKGKMSSITGLAFTATFNEAENQILNVSYLLNKSDYNTKI